MTPGSRRWPVPTWRGIGIAVTGAALVVTGVVLSRVEVGFFGVVLLAAAILAWASLFVGGRSRAVTRELSEEIAAVGSEFDVTVRAQGQSFWAVENADDAIARDVEPIAAEPAVITEHGLSLRYAVTPLRRGIREFGPLHVTSLAPLGAARRTVAVGGTSRVTVTPRLVDLTPFRRFSVAEGDAAEAVERGGQGADNLIPRPHAPGDSLRRVHWRASAHHGSLMVREEERETAPTARIVLDLSASSWPDEDAFDSAASACASAAVRLLEDGYVVAVVGTDRTVLGTVDNEAGIGDLLRVLATTEPDADEAPLIPGGRPAGATVAIWGAGSDIPDAPAVGIALALVGSAEGAGRASGAGWRAGDLSAGVRRSWSEAGRGSR